MRRASRYPLSAETAVPGKPIRTRTRPTTDGSSASKNGGGQDDLVYLGRSLLPLPSTFTAQSSYVIQAGDRLDNVSAKLLGDPLLYWMLLEANGVSDPAILCASPGRKIIVPASVGQGNSPFDQPVAGRRSTASAPSAQASDSDESAP